MTFQHKVFSVIVGLAALQGYGQTTPVVTLPKPDSAGWIKLFRGTENTQDFYTYYSGTIPYDNRKTFPDNTFKIKGDTLQVSGSPTGHAVFKQPFSHYRVRYQMRFPGSLGNCGMLIHIQDRDTTLMNSFPRSIESQGDPNQGMGQIWAISNVWVTVKAKTGSGNPQYDPTASEITYGAENTNKRCINGIKGWAQPKPAELNNGGWVTQEAEVHGSDSLAHYVMGEVMIRYRNPRVAPPNNSSATLKTLKSGLLAWQSEGTPVWYRNIEIKLYPEDPLYASLYAPVSLAMPRSGDAARMRQFRLAPGSGGIQASFAGLQGRYQINGSRLSLEGGVLRLTVPGRIQR